MPGKEAAEFSLPGDAERRRPLLGVQSPTKASLSTTTHWLCPEPRAIKLRRFAVGPQSQRTRVPFVG